MTIQILGLAVGAFSTGLDVWLGIGRIASQFNRYLHVYGSFGMLMPFCASSEVFQLVEQVLWEQDDAVALRFVDSQLQQINMVAVVGSVISGVATSGLNLKYMSKAHWTAKAFILTSLLSGLFCIYYSMRQLKILAALITADNIREWLRSPPERIRCKDKNRPSIRAVLVLDTPRTLVAMAAISYVVGLSIYIVFVHVLQLDPDSSITGSRDSMIAYFVVLWFCLALYTKADIFDHYKGRHRVWKDVVMMLILLKKILWGLPECDCENELLDHRMPTSPTIQPSIEDHGIANGEKKRSKSSRRSPRQGQINNPPPSLHSVCSSRRAQTSSMDDNTLATLKEVETIRSHDRNVIETENYLKALSEFRKDWTFKDNAPTLAKPAQAH